MKNLLNKDISIVSGGLKFECKIVDGDLINLLIDGAKENVQNMFNLCCIQNKGEYWKSFTMYGTCDVLKVYRYPEFGCGLDFPWKQ
ncbi:MAG: hypothetical protein ACD_69C00345G0002 [uncultured bacterium]|nr:MAG: hypothetical protein ACD_69C00345G0002 [uncultured bacterium]